jgi:hypothetical protein
LTPYLPLWQVKKLNIYTYISKKVLKWQITLHNLVMSLLCALALVNFKENKLRTFSGNWCTKCRFFSVNYVLLNLFIMFLVFEKAGQIHI